MKNTKLLLFLQIFLVLTLSISEERIKKQVQKQTQNYKCQGNSPFFNIKYGQENVQYVRSQLFCTNESKRSCCTSDNFKQLKQSWFIFNHQNDNISTKCQLKLNEFICQECDGDMGIQIRQGFCPQQCVDLYQSCKDDLFKFDEVIQKLKFCNKNDILCSPLHSIIEYPEQVCEKLGLAINQNTDYVQWMDDLRIFKNQTDFSNPVCHNLKPGSQIIGNGFLNETTTNKPKNNNNNSYNRFIIPAIIFLLIVFAIFLIFYLTILKKTGKTGQQIPNNYNKNKSNQAFQGKSHKLE